MTLKDLANSLAGTAAVLIMLGICAGAGADGIKGLRKAALVLVLAGSFIFVGAIWAWGFA